MIFLPENDIQKKRSGRNDDRERYWLECQQGAPLGRACAEVSTTSWNLSTSWLSPGCGTVPGCGLPQALVTGVECGYQRSNNSHAAENGPVGTWPASPTGREFMNRLRKHTLRRTVPILLLAGQAAGQSSYDLKSPDGRILKGGALVEDSA
jgi:hypothetical protein